MVTSMPAPSGNAGKYTTRSTPLSSFDVVWMAGPELSEMGTCTGAPREKAALLPPPTCDVPAGVLKERTAIAPMSTTTTRMTSLRPRLIPVFRPGTIAAGEDAPGSLRRGAERLRGGGSGGPAGGMGGRN